MIGEKYVADTNPHTGAQLTWMGGWTGISMMKIAAGQISGAGV